jgi:hypothetical protein
MKHNSCLSLKIVGKRFFSISTHLERQKSGKKDPKCCKNCATRKQQLSGKKQLYASPILVGVLFFFCKIIFQKLNETHLNTLELRLLYGYTRAKYQAALDKRIDRG